MSITGVLLINLGTPQNCDSKSVRHYLREFLNDSRVIDLPFLIRWILVNGIIVPFRYRKTTQAYQKIWQATGSPLLWMSQQIKTSLSNELGTDYHVELGMRYGEPSIQMAFDHLKFYDSLIVIPLFPQYASAATGSAIAELMSVVAKQWNIPKLIIQNDFYQHAGFVRAYAEIIAQYIFNKEIDLLVFSYHGLPERHINKSNCQASCDRLNTCPRINENNRFCYRAQCHATTYAIVKQLGLDSNQYTICFQSRLGRTPWIKPYTDLVLPDLIKKGIKNIGIVSPSFVADCLETLEEINIRTREQWKLLGGQEFIFIPCLNYSSTWIQALAEMIKQ